MAGLDHAKEGREDAIILAEELLRIRRFPQASAGADCAVVRRESRQESCHDRVRVYRRSRSLAAKSERHRNPPLFDGAGEKRVS